MEYFGMFTIGAAMVGAGVWLGARGGHRAVPGAAPVAGSATAQGDESGAVIGRYRLERLLARGRTWHVYSASPVAGGEGDVVVKLLSMHAVDRGIDMKSWLAAVESYSRVQHPAILGFLGWGQENGRWFLVQRFSAARPLSERTDLARAPLEEVLPLVDQLLEAVSALHEAGIIHGRLALNRIHALEGRIELWDLGMQRNRNRSVVGQDTLVDGLSRMAPEADLTERRDQYLLGRAVWEMLAGRSLVTDRNPMVAAHKLMTVPAEPLHVVRADVPTPLSEVVSRMMALHAEARYDSVADARRAWHTALDLAAVG